MKSNTDKTFYWAPWHYIPGDELKAIALSVQATDPTDGYGIYKRMPDGCEMHMIDSEHPEDCIKVVNELNNVEDDRFPHGFDNWHETHFEIIAYLQETVDINENGLAGHRQAEQGRGGLYELAQELTDEFERQYKDIDWDGEWWETIDSFLKGKEDEHEKVINSSNNSKK